MPRRGESAQLVLSVPVEFTTLGEYAQDMAVYGWRNLSFVIWNGPASVEGVAVLRDISVRFRDLHPEGTSTVHIVRGGIALPSTEARQGLVTLSNDFAESLAAVGVVIGGSGFWASTMRSVVTALRVLGSRAFELRIHGKVEELLEWLPAAHLKRTGVALDVAQLTTALHKAESLVAR